MGVVGADHRPALGDVPLAVGLQRRTEGHNGKNKLTDHIGKLIECQRDNLSFTRVSRASRLSSQSMREVSTSTASAAFRRGAAARWASS